MTCTLLFQIKISFHFYSCHHIRTFNYTLVAVETPFSAPLSLSLSFFFKVFGDLFCWGFSSSSSITPATFSAFTLQYLVLHYKNTASKRKTRAMVVPGDHLSMSQCSKQDVILYHYAEIL